MNLLQSFIDRVRQAIEYVKSKETDLAKIGEVFAVLQNAINDVLSWFSGPSVSSAVPNDSAHKADAVKQLTDLQTECEDLYDEETPVTTSAATAAAVPPWASLLLPLIMTVIQQVLNKLKTDKS